MEKNRQEKESYLLKLFLFLMPLLVQNMVNAKNTRLAKTRQLRARQPRVFLPIPLSAGELQFRVGPRSVELAVPASKELNPEIHSNRLN